MINDETIGENRLRGKQDSVAWRGVGFLTCRCFAMLSIGRLGNLPHVLGSLGKQYAQKSKMVPRLLQFEPQMHRNKGASSHKKFPASVTPPRLFTRSPLHSFRLTATADLRPKAQERLVNEKIARGSFPAGLDNSVAHRRSRPQFFPAPRPDRPSRFSGCDSPA